MASFLIGLMSVFFLFQIFNAYLLMPMVPALLGLFSVTSKNFSITNFISIPWGLGKPVKNVERVSFQAPTFKVSAFIRCLNFLVQFASVVVCTILFVVKILALGSNPNRYESIYCSMHRRSNCQFSVRWIHYSHWRKFTGRSHLCAIVILWNLFYWDWNFFKEENSCFTYLNFHKIVLQFSYCKGTYINDVRRFRSFLTRFQLRPSLMIFHFEPQSNRFVKKMWYFWVQCT